jgi:aspartyl protease family protein
MNDLSQSQMISLIIYGLIGLYLCAMIVRLFRGSLVTGTLTLAFWAIALLAVVSGYSYRSELQGVADRVMATVVPGLPIDSGTKEVTILRGNDGQFVVRGTAAGVHVAFILDTGASAVVLRAEDAIKLGIDPRRLAFDAEVSTANGRALTAQTMIPDLAIGNVRETNVPVLVAKPGALHENLLGMSFLDRLASFSVAGNKLILHGR